MQRGLTAKQCRWLLPICWAGLIAVPAVPALADAEFQPVDSDARAVGAAESQDGSGSDPRARKITPPGEDSGRPLSESGGASSSLGAFWSTLGALGVVVVLILGLGRLWKKHGPMGGIGGDQGTIELLGRRVLGARQSVFLVRLGSRILVLGASPEGLRTLSEITDPVEVDSLAALSRKQQDQTGLAETFRSLLRTRSSRPVAGETSRGGAGSAERDLVHALRPAARHGESSLEGAHG